MTDESDGRNLATKRKATVREDFPPAKMAANFNRTKRGLFKEYNHIYKEDGKSIRYCFLQHHLLKSPLL